MGAPHLAQTEPFLVPFLIWEGTDRFVFVEHLCSDTPGSEKSQIIGSNPLRLTGFHIDNRYSVFSSETLNSDQHLIIPCFNQKPGCIVLAVCASTNVHWVC